MALKDWYTKMDQNRFLFKIFYLKEEWVIVKYI